MKPDELVKQLYTENEDRQNGAAQRAKSEKKKHYTNELITWIMLSLGAVAAIWLLTR